TKPSSARFCFIWALLIAASHPHP
ncbi:hypothetical protein VCHC44C1_2689B, partial [Vibrio cholerae HC-44C1]